MIFRNDLSVVLPYNLEWTTCCC